jgi:hypothetical protein
MENLQSFISEITSFDYFIIFDHGSYYGRRPIYSKTKRIWELKEDHHSKYFWIRKGAFFNSLVFLNYNHKINTMNSADKVYTEYLEKSFDQFKVNLEEIISNPELNPDFYQSMGYLIAVLEKALSGASTERIFLFEKEGQEEVFQMLSWHSKLQLRFGNLEGREPQDLTNMCYINFIISQHIDLQLSYISRSQELLKTELEKWNKKLSHENLRKPESMMLINELDEQIEVASNSNRIRNFEKIIFKEHINILATLFYDLSTEGYLSTSVANLERFLCDSFTDVNGKPLSLNTVKTYLKPNNESKRAKIGKRIIVPSK